MTQKLNIEREEDPTWIRADISLDTPGKMFHQQINEKPLVTNRRTALCFSGYCILECFTLKNKLFTFYNKATTYLPQNASAGPFLNLIDIVREKSTSNVHLNSKVVKAFQLNPSGYPSWAY